MDTDHGQVRGSAAEHIAAAALLLNGYKVYHQDHESGSSDLIAEKAGELMRVQVKAFFWRQYAAPSLTACLSNTRKGIRKDVRGEVHHFALVNLDTAEVVLLDAVTAPKTEISFSVSKIRGRLIFPIQPTQKTMEATPA